MEQSPLLLPLKPGPLQSNPILSLRPYQHEAVDTLWRAAGRESRLLCWLPTASGKTEIFAELIRRAACRTVVLINNVRLVAQTARRLNCAAYCAGAGSKEIGFVTAASIQSIHSVEHDAPQLIILDEAHNYGEGLYESYLSRFPDAKILGFTATPWKNNAPIYGDDKFFPRITFTRSMNFMIEHGYIVPPILKEGKEAFRTAGLRERNGDWREEDIASLTSDEGRVRKQVKDAMGRLAERQKIVWACSSIDHANMVRSMILENSCLMHSKNPMNAFHQETFEKTDHVRHMVSVMMISEGYDFPAIDAIVFMRPTKSIRLYVQVVGRGLRLSTGKANCLVLDYGEVVKNCGPVNNPIVGRDVKKSDKDTVIQTVWCCPQCLSFVERDRSECGDCGAQRPEYEAPQARALVPETVRDILGILDEKELYNVTKITLGTHVSKAGNNCVKIEYHVGEMWPIAEYISSHPFSWNKGRRRLSALGFDYPSFEEAFGMLSNAVTIDVNLEIETMIEKGFKKVSRVTTGNRSVTGGESAAIL